MKKEGSLFFLKQVSISWKGKDGFFAWKAAAVSKKNRCWWLVTELVLWMFLGEDLGTNILHFLHRKRTIGSWTMDGFPPQKRRFSCFQGVPAVSFFLGGCNHICGCKRGRSLGMFNYLENNQPVATLNFHQLGSQQKQRFNQLPTNPGTLLCFPRLDHLAKRIMTYPFLENHPTKV